MAKRIIWSADAKMQLREILEFFKERNQTSSYSIKLNNFFKKTVSHISNHPKVGIRTGYGDVRAKVVSDFIIFYEEQETSINILVIWDCRQDPEKLDKFLRK